MIITQTVRPFSLAILHFTNSQIHLLGAQKNHLKGDGPHEHQ